MLVAHSLEKENGTNENFQNRAHSTTPASSASCNLVSFNILAIKSKDCLFLCFKSVIEVSKFTGRL
jgi:hypothetical protein